MEVSEEEINNLFWSALNSRNFFIPVEEWAEEGGGKDENNKAYAAGASNMCEEFAEKLAFAVADVETMQEARDYARHRAATYAEDQDLTVPKSREEIMDDE